MMRDEAYHSDNQAIPPDRLLSASIRQGLNRRLATISWYCMRMGRGGGVDPPQTLNAKQSSTINIVINLTHVQRECKHVVKRFY